MYSKPALERFGTFRDLTQFGFNGTSDGFTISGPNGNGTTTSPGCGLNVGLPGYQCPGNTGPTAS